MTTRVLIVDDQSLVRAGFRLILESQPDFAVVGEAPDGEQAVASMQQTSAFDHTANRILLSHQSGRGPPESTFSLSPSSGYFAAQPPDDSIMS